MEPLSAGPVVPDLDALATECAYAIGIILCVLDPELVIKTSKPFAQSAVMLPCKTNGVNFVGLSGFDPNTDPINGKSFKQQKGVEIDVDTLASDTKAPIFTKTGVYEFMVSDNLEIDAAFTQIYSCKVKLSAQAVKPEPQASSTCSVGLSVLSMPASI